MCSMWIAICFFQNVKQTKMSEHILAEKAALCIKMARNSNLKIATAESCTGGMVAALLTSIEGASATFDRGFVVYSNSAKRDMLGVSKRLMDACGAVSPQVVAAMLSGIIKNSNADIGIAITGIAGPGGGSKDKPVGLVYVGYVSRGQEPKFVAKKFSGDRDQVRCQAADQALGLIIKCIKGIE